MPSDQQMWEIEQRKKKKKPTRGKPGPAPFAVGEEHGVRIKPAAKQASMPRASALSQPKTAVAVAPKSTEQKIRDIVLGYYNVNKVLPGPGKTADLLGTALASVNDSKAWSDFFMRVLTDSKEGMRPQLQEVTSEDIFYGGSLKREEPLMDRVLRSPWSPTYLMAETPYFKRVFEQDLSVELTIPGNKSFRDVMTAALANPDISTEALGKMGLIAPSVGPVDPKKALTDGVKEFVMRHNLADAVWLEPDDPAQTSAQQNVWATHLTDQKMTPAQSLRLLHSDDESLRQYVYEMTYTTKDPNISDYEFQEWYAKRYGGDKLPAELAKTMLQGRYMKGMPEFIGSIGYLLGINNPEAAKFAEATYGKTELGRKFDAGTTAIVDSIGSSNITKKALEAAALPFVYGEQAGTAFAWSLADILHKSHPGPMWDANKSLMSHAAQNWKAAKGHTAVDELLRLGGVDPLDHEWISWAGTMGFETLLGMGIDRAGAVVLGGMAKSGAAAKVSRGFGAKATTDLLAQNKSPFINSEFFGHKIHPEDAVRLADDLNTPEDVQTFFDTTGKLYMGDAKFDPNFPSLKVTHQIKHLQDDTIPPQQRALYMPEEQSAIDMNGPNAALRGYQQAIHAGLPQSEAVAFADEIIRAKAGFGDDWEKQIRVRSVFDGLANRIDEFHQGIPETVTPKFEKDPTYKRPKNLPKNLKPIPVKAQWPDLIDEIVASGIENPTGEDVYNLINRKWNHFLSAAKGRELIATPRKPVSFAPGNLDPMRERYGHIEEAATLLDDLDTLHGEMSVGLDPVIVKTIDRKIAEAQADLKAYRDALIANRREKKAYLASKPVERPAAPETPALSLDVFSDFYGKSTSTKTAAGARIADANLAWLKSPSRETFAVAREAVLKDLRAKVAAAKKADAKQPVTHGETRTLRAERNLASAEKVTYPAERSVSTRADTVETGLHKMLSNAEDAELRVADIRTMDEMGLVDELKSLGFEPHPDTLATATKTELRQLVLDVDSFIRYEEVLDFLRGMRGKIDDPSLVSAAVSAMIKLSPYKKVDDYGALGKLEMAAHEGRSADAAKILDDLIAQEEKAMMNYGLDPISPYVAVPTSRPQTAFRDFLSSYESRVAAHTTPETPAGPDPTLQAFEEADAYRLRKLAEANQKLKDAEAERAGLTAKNAGKAIPVTPSQSHRFYEPKHDNTVLSLMNSSPSYRKWALSSTAFRSKQLTKVFRYIVLWKMSTVFRILTDEGLRLLLDDIWPSLPLPGGTDWRATIRPPVTLGKSGRGKLRNPLLVKSYMTPEARAAMEKFPEYEAKLSGMFERVAREAWTPVKPEDAALWAKSYPGHVARHNAGPKGDPPYRDWAQAWQTSMHEQTHPPGGEVLAETPAMVLKASDDATSHLRSLITSDPFYLGDKTHTGWLRQQNIVLEDFLKNADSPHAVDEYVDAVGNMGLRFVSHKVTREHFLQGPKSFSSSQLRTAAADAGLRARIGVIEGEASSTYHNASTAKKAGMYVADAPYKVLDTFGTQMKQESFGTYFTRQMSELRSNPSYRLMGDEALSEQAAINAFEEASRRNYMATHSALEGRMGHVFLFLPAYVQQAKFWAPWLAKHPATGYAALSNASQMPANVGVPDWFPILGGMSTVDLRNMTVFPGSLRELPPPVTPIASTAADIAVGFSVPGAEGVRSALGYGRGFPQGLPWNTSIDAMLYAGTGGWWNPGQWLTDDKVLGTKFHMKGAQDIAAQRARSTLVNLQVQFINGEPLNVGKAKRTTLWKQGAKGAEKFIVPVGVQITLPTVFITKNGKRTKLDLQRVADGQYAYLAALPEARRDVLLAYPEYAPIAKAWDLTGDAQLKYLYDNQWVIPFVETKYEKSQIAAAALKLGGTGSGDMLDPEVYAANLKDRFKKVVGWKLNSDYQVFIKKNVEDWAKAERKVLTPYQKDHFDKWTLPQRLLEQTRVFQKSHKKEITDTFGSNSLDVNAEIGDKLPMWVAEVKTSSTTMSDGEYNFLSSLEKSRSSKANKLLTTSPVYDEYLVKKDEKRLESIDKFIKAATVHYKSQLTPDEFAALGIKIPKGFEGKKDKDGRYPTFVDGKLNGVNGFLGLIDQQSAIMDKLYAQGKFASDEYKTAYRKKWALIAKGRKDPTLRAILNKPVSEFLISGPNALNEPHWKDLSGVHPAVHADAVWKKIKHEFLVDGMTPKRVLEVRRKYGGVIGDNFDEAVRAWSWAYVDSVAKAGRNALTSTDNPRGWASGWTIESKYGKTMQKWMVDSTSFLFDRKHPMSRSFLREWEVANKAAGGNLLDDMINPQM